MTACSGQASPLSMSHGAGAYAHLRRTHDPLAMDHVAGSENRFDVTGIVLYRYREHCFHGRNIKFLPNVGLDPFNAVAAKRLMQ